MLDGVLAVGDPISVLPRFFHLLWSNELMMDLTVPLHMSAIVSLPEAM
ncbi:hypothetical protein [Actinomadura sp. B10D3]